MTISLRRTTWLLAAGFASTACITAACGSSGDGSRLSSAGAGADSGTGTASANGGAGGFTLSQGTGTASGGSGGSCAGVEETAALGDAFFYIMVDKSGSMSSNNKWTNARNAFNAFFVDPQADPLNVALRFWPDNGCGEPSGTCGNSALQACATPQVAMDSLTNTSHENALVSAFNAESPTGLTPMSVALDGAVNYLTGLKANGESQDAYAVLLVTDGDPTDCDTNVGNIANIAGNGYNNNGILTFAIGLPGSNQNTLDQIAQQGGTQQGFIVQNNTQALIDTLKAIAGSVVACTFAMPDDPSPDMPIDPKQVNVLYNGTPVPQVASQADCGPNGGWYYDNNANPTAIFLCPTTCSTVQTDDMAQIKISIGCATIVQ